MVSKILSKGSHPHEILIAYQPLDMDFTLRKYTMAEFLRIFEKVRIQGVSGWVYRADFINDIFKYLPVSIMQNNLYRIQNNASQNRHTSYTQYSYPSGNIITQPTFPQPYNGIQAPPMPFTPTQVRSMIYSIDYSFTVITLDFGRCLSLSHSL